jgi:predicted PolB exonuclease-like 3'-5' exonuclease
MSDPFAIFGTPSAAAVADPPPPAITTAEPPKPAVTPEEKPQPIAGTKKRSSPLYIDIETIPDESRAHLFGLEPLPTPAEYLAENDSTPPSELLRGTIDEVKSAIARSQASGKKLPRVVVAACIVSEKNAAKPRKGVIDLFSDMLASIDGEADAIVAATENQRKTMSVTPEFCRVVSLGYAIGSEKPTSLTVGNSGITELDLLKRFWELVASTKGPIVGYNVAGFDLPVLFVRSALLGVDATRKIDLTPWKGDVCDLMQARFPRGGSRRLKDLARLMGIEVPAEGVDGSQVYGLYAAGKLDEIAAYVQSDVDVSRSLHRLYGGFFC